MIGLYQDPHGERIFSDPSNPSHGTLTLESKKTVIYPLSTQVGVEGDIATLQQKIQDQEKMILERDKRISKLENELSTFKVSRTS